MGDSQALNGRLARQVIRYFKETGKGWQARLNETLEKYVATVAKRRKR